MLCDMLQEPERQHREAQLDLSQLPFEVWCTILSYVPLKVSSTGGEPLHEALVCVHVAAAPTHLSGCRWQGTSSGVTPEVAHFRAQAGNSGRLINFGHGVQTFWYPQHARLHRPAKYCMFHIQWWAQLLCWTQSSCRRASAQHVGVPLDLSLPFCPHPLYTLQLLRCSFSCSACGLHVCSYDAGAPQHMQLGAPLPLQVMAATDCF